MAEDLDEEKRRLKEDQIEIDNVEDGIKTMDQVFETVGAFGPWQIITTVIFAWMQLVTGMGNMMIVFMQFKPTMLCEPEGMSQDLWAAKLAEMSPKNDSDRCGSNTTTCSAFHYSTSVMSRTIVTDWDLVCGREWETATAQMVHMLGILIGSAFIGPLGDKFGRRYSIFGFMVVFVVAFGVQAFVPTYPLFLLCRFLAAISITGSWMTPFTYLGEMTSGYYRTVVTGLFFMPYAIGYALLSPLAYVTRDWRVMSGVIGLSMAPLLGAFWWFLESPRWLVTQGRLDDAAELLQNKIAVRNRRVLPSGFDMRRLLGRILKAEQGGSERQSESMVSVLKFPTLIIRSVIVILLWFTNNVVYYGISLNITSFSGNLFLNNAIFALVEIPSYGLATLLLRWGRKGSQILLLVVAGASLLSVPWVPVGAASLGLAVVGKLAISASFAAIYVFTAELYPTIIRNSGMGLSSMASRVGGMVAPYVSIIADMDPNLSFVPLVLFGCLAIGGAVLVLFLPETLGRPLPDTLEEAAHPPPLPKVPVDEEK